MLDYIKSAHDEMTEVAGHGRSAMIDKAAAKLKSDGWKLVETTGFLHLIGPLWQRLVDGAYEYALVTEDKHHNRNGLVQGGVLMTFADRTCGMTAHFPARGRWQRCNSIRILSKPARSAKSWFRARTWCARREA